ncbi:MAG: ABC transporter ATP-binding protein [Bacteroidales bacterium]|nr:ABC transporter ATP-binding protein [Bacteroidales bacterium]
MTMDKSGASLLIENLSVDYKTYDGTANALNGFDLSIEAGKAHGLIGETGAGKTTAALAIMGLIACPPGRISSGSIIFDNVNLLDKSEKEMERIRGKQISMIFQDPMTSLNPVMSMEEQIAEVISLHEGFSKIQSLNKAHEMLEIVGIPASRGHEYPHQFSGGMKQRVVIAMALACNPQLLIADEPTTALDVTIQAQVLEKIKQVRQMYGMSLLMITHDLGVVAETCDEVSIIYAGRVVEHGTVEDIFDHNLHPYTQGLFDSLPNLKDRRAKLRPIKGLMPDPSNLPVGCSFCLRCNYATELCYKVKPERKYRNEGHYVECHLYEEPHILESKVRNHG